MRAMVSLWLRLSTQGSLTPPHHFPLPLSPCEHPSHLLKRGCMRGSFKRERSYERASGKLQRWPTSAHSLDLQMFYSKWETGQASDRGSYPDYTQQPLFAFEVKCICTYSSNIKTVSNRGRAWPRWNIGASNKYVLRIRYQPNPSVSWGIFSWRYRGRCLLNCVVWAVFKMHLVENTRSWERSFVMLAKNNNRVMQRKLYPFTENMRDAVMSKSISH